jgi:hypothetical protein
MKHKADPALRLKPNYSNRSTATTGISLTLALLTVIALYFFWHIDSQSHRTQVQLMQIDSAINLSNGTEWKAVARADLGK